MAFTVDNHRTRDNRLRTFSTLAMAVRVAEGLADETREAQTIRQNGAVELIVHPAEKSEPQIIAREWEV